MTRLLAAVGIILPFLACAPPARVRLLAHMPPEQERFLKERLIKPFEKKNHCVVEVSTYHDAADLPRRLALSDSIFDLVEIPSEMAPSLVRGGTLAPLDSLIGAAGWEQWRRDFFLTDLSKVGANRYLLPRFLETKLLLYSRARVREAAEHWTSQRGEIDTALSRYNGKGLPLDYRLEENPAHWDFFDLFVAGWFWKTHEARGVKRGRLVCPSGEGAESVLALWDQGFRLGADTASLARMSGPAVRELFQWQAAFTQEGLCQSASAKNGPAPTATQLFQSGEAFLADAYPREIWRIHGNESVQLPALAAHPEDLGVAPLPKGVSLALDGRGLPRKEGQSGASTRIWWLALSARSQSKPLSISLAAHLSATKNQVEECAGFGLVPARKDLLADLGLLYGGPWMEEAYQAAARQLLENRYVTGPRRTEFTDLAKLYSEAYRQLCSNRKTQTPAEIAQALEQRFAPRARQILGEPEERQLSQNP